MYSAAIPATSSMNGMGSGMIDGTINPAALNTPASIIPNPPSINAQVSPRGQKRSRSPEQSGDPFGVGIEDDDQKPKKRGRPPKSKLSEESPNSVPSQQGVQNSPEQLRTPQPQAQSLPQDLASTPTGTSPSKAPPTKAVIKALPTVRDHTTDQLTYEQDEYLPREYDEDGERKVSPTGEPLGGRQFKMRTFYVAHRGEKRFMLATECARVLGYRDSYLLFNKNRSLHKIIASQQEKDELIHQEILPYSYRSRQIAIVTAKSMFRQFGARVIEGGRRVRDDYWQAKAIKQGFTDEDMAGDKRPGATKARDAAAAAEASQVPLSSPGYGQQHDVAYANATMEGPDHSQQLGTLQMMTRPDDSRLQAYGNIPRPRQEMAGAPYQDRTQPSSAADVLHQASNAADLSKQHTQQRASREKHFKEHWNREPDIPVSTPQQMEQTPTATQSPHPPASSLMGTQSLLHHQSGQGVSPQSNYSSHHQQPAHHHNPSQSPIHNAMPSSIRPDLSHHRSSISYSSNQHPPQTSPYGYPQHSQQMWGHPPPHPQQPHQSPISSHQSSLPQYSPSPHPPQGNLQHNPSQSPHTQHPPPPIHPQSSGAMHAGVPYQTMPGIPGGSSSYSNAAAMANVRAMYSPSTASPGHQQYMQQQATTATQQAGMQGWAPPPLQPHQQQQQQHHHQSGWQGYPSSTGY